MMNQNSEGSTSGLHKLVPTILMDNMWQPYNSGSPTPTIPFSTSRIVHVNSFPTITQILSF